MCRRSIPAECWSTVPLPLAAITLQAVSNAPACLRACPCCPAVGIATNRMLAKICSDLNKPNGGLGHCACV
jgi:hypothetical protein